MQSVTHSVSPESSFLDRGNNDSYAGSNTCFTGKEGSIRGGD